MTTYTNDDVLFSALNARINAAYVASQTSKPGGVTTAQGRLTAIAAWAPAGGLEFDRGLQSPTASLPAWPPTSPYGTEALWLDRVTVLYGGTTGAAETARRLARKNANSDLRTAYLADQAAVVNAILTALSSAVTTYNSTQTLDNVQAVIDKINAVYTALGAERDYRSDMFLFNATYDPTGGRAAYVREASEGGPMGYLHMLGSTNPFGSYPIQLSVPADKTALDARVAARGTLVTAL